MFFMRTFKLQNLSLLPPQFWKISVHLFHKLSSPLPVGFIHGPERGFRLFLLTGRLLEESLSSLLALLVDLLNPPIASFLDGVNSHFSCLAIELALFLTFCFGL
jgi:hypothetical protein